MSSPSWPAVPPDEFDADADEYIPLEEMKDRIAAYRDGRERAGLPAEGGEARNAVLRGGVTRVFSFVVAEWSP